VLALVTFIFGQTLCVMHCAADAGTPSKSRQCCHPDSQSSDSCPAKDQSCFWQNGATVQDAFKSLVTAPSLKLPLADSVEVPTAAILPISATKHLSSAPPGRFRPELSLGKSARALGPPW
jgi:hypothetical protein